MIGYVTLGTNDLEKSAAFYDALLAELGAKRFMEMENFIAWTSGPSGCGLGITRPHDGDAACVGNGVSDGCIGCR
jgi:catechol 2,3-dioxygenase-like lactoylglutathione lyase family enzyme